MSVVRKSPKPDTVALEKLRDTFIRAKSSSHLALDFDQDKNYKNAIQWYNSAVGLFYDTLSECGNVLKNTTLSENNIQETNDTAAAASKFIAQLEERAQICAKALKEENKNYGKDLFSKSNSSGRLKPKKMKNDDPDFVVPEKPTNVTARGRRKSSEKDIVMSSSPIISSQRKSPAIQKQNINENPIKELQQSQPEERKIGMEIFDGVDRKFVDIVLNELVEHKPSVTWDDIGGLENVKLFLKEAVINPSLRPDLYSGLRSPAKGVLLFGPPGNGKTMLAKALANECKSRFFSISASSLTSKWVGESEKIVRALFACARFLQPSVIFIDEIDSVLTARSSNDSESGRRLKTEFLVQFDGVGTSVEDRVILLGATNRPQDLDEAVIRRLPRRIYLPLPDVETRHAVLINLLKDQHSMTKKQLQSLAQETENYSCADLAALAREAALYPLRDVKNILEVRKDDVRKINRTDFEKSIKSIRPSVTSESLKEFEEWNSKYGEKM